MDLPPSPKRIKLEPSELPPPSLSENDQNQKDIDDFEQDHCTICLEPLLDRTIIPVCAHEFCFECISLWSEQSRKCPLCSRSFNDSYLIHHIRSQYDYQKRYLPPLRSSPPPLTGESRANALRNTRRERQWGRRQRQQREEADQLERAIARRRWIYQHHLYAKHVASNPYTRYRPFPTSAQFSASPDLISRMTTFLRRELRVWPNLDIEFLTTYTISLMKSIDVRSESAVKLLSEFLDLDTPYTAGERHVNAEHFAHEIYSYLRSPYRDLNMYDQMAQYDAPPEISPLDEIERGGRWDAEPSPPRRSRSQSSLRPQSPVPHHENNAMRSPAARHGRDSSAEARREDRPNYGHGPTRSPPSREDHDFRNHPSNRRHSPSGGAQDNLRDANPGRVSYSEPSLSTFFAENQDNNDFVIQQGSRRDDKGKGHATEATENIVVAADTPKMSAPQGDDSAAALISRKSSVTCLTDEETNDEVADYVDDVHCGSTTIAQQSRKRSAGLSVHARLRNRTLSESVQAYLSRPAAPARSLKKPIVSGPSQTSDTGTTDTRPRLLLRLTDGPSRPAIGKLLSPRKVTVERTADGPSTLDDDAAFEQPPRSRPFRSRSLSSNHATSTDADRSDYVADGALRSGHGDGDVSGPFSPANALELQDGRGGDGERGRTDMDTLPAAPARPSIFYLGERPGRADGSATVGDDALPTGDPTLVSRFSSGFTTGSGSILAIAPKLTDVTVDVDMSVLETRLRVRAHVRARLAALKGTVEASGSGPRVAPKTSKG